MANSFLDLYFERIGYSGSPRADLQTLCDLHRLHLENIPFENIDVFCLQDVRLDRESLSRKILQCRRGGYCFELNGLFLDLLTELGFTCCTNLARVHYGRPQPGPPRLAVKGPDRRILAERSGPQGGQDASDPLTARAGRVKPGREPH